MLNCRLQTNVWNIEKYMMNKQLNPIHESWLSNDRGTMTVLYCTCDSFFELTLARYKLLLLLCSGSVVVTAYDSESGRPGSNPEWGLIYYKASITAQGLPEPSSLWSSTLGTRVAEHKGCNWACKLTDGCSPKSCVRPHLQAYATEI